MRRINSLGVQLVMGACLMMAAAAGTSANPIVVPPVVQPEDGIYRLFLVNLPIDVLVFSSVFLLLFWRLKSPLWSKQVDVNRLIGLVIIAGVAIAAVGAFIDFYGFYDEHAYGAGMNEGYWADLSPERMAISAACIFACVYIASFALARLRLVPSLIPSSAITALNLVAWILIEDPIVLDGMGTVLLAGVLFLFVPPVAFGIIHVHAKKEAKS